MPSPVFNRYVYHQDHYKLVSLALQTRVANAFRDYDRFAIPVNGQWATPTHGYVVVVPIGGPIVDLPSHPMVERFLANLPAWCEYIGGWKRPDGTYTVDTVLILQDLVSAHHLSRAFKQMAFYSLHDRESIYINIGKNL